MARGDGSLKDGVFRRGGANSPGFMNNIGLEAATTTNANDSIRITSADGTALTEENVGYVTVGSATGGLLTTFRVSADVTIDLTGAHWGEGTKGDLTDYMLSVYAINDSGALKWGVASIPGHKLILGTDDQATATNVTVLDHVLVTSALTTNCPCVEVGWFRANFDDAGGAAADLWTVQTGGATPDIFLGPRPRIPQYWTPSGSGWTTNCTYTGRWSRDGAMVIVEVLIQLSGAPDTASLLTGLPGGLVIDTDVHTLESPTATVNGYLYCSDAGVVTPGFLFYEATTGLDCRYLIASTTPVTSAAITQAAPFTFANGDLVQMYYTVPISGWS